MKLQYIASLLMMLGATQAELFATFATGKFIQILAPWDID
jgi:hypothetical protein